MTDKKDPGYYTSEISGDEGALMRDYEGNLYEVKKGKWVVTETSNQYLQRKIEKLEKEFRRRRSPKS